MKVRALDQINSHWLDGRHLSAGAGAEVYADDDDKDAVAHLEALVKAGVAEVVKDEPAEQASSKKTGRPPMPRDEDGNIIREQAG